MRKRKVAVQDNLTPVRELLQQRGYEVVDMNNFKSCDAVVLTGGSENMMGIQTTETKAPVINATGRTAKDIVNEIERFIG